MANSSVLIRAARKGSGLTQTGLSAATGVDQASVSRHERGQDAAFTTVDRLLAGSGHRLYAAPTRRDDAATAAASIRHHLRVGDRDRALRALIQLNDDLLAEDGLVRGVLGITEPEPIGDPLWDAAIAALVAWRLDAQAIPRPPWVDDPRRSVDRREALRIDPADPVPEADDVPAPFLERGVLVWADTFSSV